MDFLKTEAFLIALLSVNVFLIVLFIINSVIISKQKKHYNSFMKNISNGGNIEEMLVKYINKVEEVSKKNTQIETYIKDIDVQVSTCIQKVGIVRYSAYKSVGSDLSFALAILDQKDNGIVLNGIYSREMSNIYAKPVVARESAYSLSIEEKQAINLAINKKV
ncbi:MAG: DUF4446 family protein [Lachnospiraceae bacterium]|jgi:hypothetical protein|nr:DUF4446 family protein [Lachnospiraceae bacterium]